MKKWNSGWTVDKENDFNLNISRYVSTAEPEERVDLARESARIKAADGRWKSEQNYRMQTDDR